MAEQETRPTHRVRPEIRAAGSEASVMRPDQCLNKHQRLLRAVQFKEAFETDPAFVGRRMVMRLRRAEDASLRLGVVTSKRTFRRAVDRNMARRRLREAFRRLRGELSGQVDAVFVGRYALLKSTQQEVEKEMRWLCRKAGLLPQETKAPPTDR